MRRRTSLIHGKNPSDASNIKGALAGREANLLGQNGPDHAADRYLVQAETGDLVVPLSALSDGTRAALERHLGPLEDRLVERGTPPPALVQHDGLSLAQEADIPSLLALGAAMHAETLFARVPLQLDRFEDHIRAALADRAHQQIFVHKANGVLQGALFARADPYIFSDAIIVSDQLFYIFPQHRSFALARRMVQAVEVWARSKNATEVCLAVSTGKNLGRLDALYARFRYQRVGGVFKKLL